MKTCEEHGSAILVYDGHNCPACVEIEELTAKLLDAENKIDSLLDELRDARAQ
jgi:hypothetical protein